MVENGENQTPITIGSFQKLETTSQPSFSTKNLRPVLYRMLVKKGYKPRCAICEIKGRVSLRKGEFRFPGFILIWLSKNPQLKKTMPLYQFKEIAELVCTVCFTGHWTEGRTRQQRYDSIRQTISEKSQKTDMSRQLILAGLPSLPKKRMMQIGHPDKPTR